MTNYFNVLLDKGIHAALLVANEDEKKEIKKMQHNGLRLKNQIKYKPSHKVLSDGVYGEYYFDNNGIRHYIADNMATHIRVGFMCSSIPIK